MCRKFHALFDETVVGSLYLRDCPAQRYLPIYLIVAGVFAFCSGGGDGAKLRSRCEFL